MADRVILIDTFSYNGEPIVELRLEYLAQHVDQFVMIEARYTHSGVEKKELWCDKHAHIFTPYIEAGKLVIIVIDKFPPMPADWPQKYGNSYMNADSYESWFREQFQRDLVVEYLEKRYKAREYIVICGDVDEIVNADILKDIKKSYFALGEPAYLEMKFYYYNFTWLKKYPWYKAFIINDMGLRRHSLSSYRNRQYATQVIAKAGWHASYFMDIDGLRKKLESFAHRECDLNERKTEEHLQACLMEGKDIAGRGDDEQCIPADVTTLPFVFQKFHTKMMQDDVASSTCSNC